MKQAFNLCSSSEKFSDEDKDYIHFYCAVRSILFKLTKGDAPDIEQMNARVRKMLEGQFSPMALRNYLKPESIYRLIFSAMNIWIR